MRGEDSAEPAGLRSAGYRGSLEADRPLASWTTWRIGGPASWAASPEQIEDLRLVVALGRGTLDSLSYPRERLQPADRRSRSRGLVIRLRKVMDAVELRPDGSLRVGAGASFPALARYAARNGLAGLEFATGIPGTVGGALVMNAGWHEYEIGPLVR